MMAGNLRGLRRRLHSWVVAPVRVLNCREAGVNVLHRDYETRSTVDLRKCGAHVYAEHPTTEVIVAVFIIEQRDGKLGDPFVWHPGETVPQIVTIAANGGWTIAGHNAAFEQAIDRHLLGPKFGFPIFPDEQIDCTLARSAVQAIPQDLDRACRALSLRRQKDKAGHRLMLQMCKPRKPRKDEDPDGIYWHFDADKLARLTAYCIDDVYAEIDLGRALRPLQDQERKVWLLDQRMNNRGVQIDTHFVDTAATFVERAAARADAEMSAVTGGAVPKASNVDKLKTFVKSHWVELKIITKTSRATGDEYDAEVADKEAVHDLLASELPNDAVRRALEIRLEAGKSSTKKLKKFLLQTCADGRARGNLQYHGAGPGRWAGRGIQLQNMIRAGITEPGGWHAAFRDMLAMGDNLDLFDLVWGSPLGVVSRMTRGAVIAAPGKQLYFGDYAAVEARGSVWAAKQYDMVDLFARGGPIYEEMGAFIFGLTVEEVAELHKSKRDLIPRFCGKETVLGCGYGMGWRAFQRNAKKKGNVLLPDDTCTKAVSGWRDKNSRVVELWRELEDAARAAIESPGKVFTAAGLFSYRVNGSWLQCRLPSGRLLWYYKPRLKPDEKDRDHYRALGEPVPRYRWKIHYWGVNSVTKQWEEESTWGGKFLENCIQGMCRDFLAAAMLRLESAGYIPILSVHDEAICETPAGFGSTDEFLSIMSELPPWARGFPLKAEGGRGTRYAKG